MASVLHGNARTPLQIRAELRKTKAAAHAVAAQYGVNVKTVLKWRKRCTTVDAQHGEDEP